MAIAAGQKLGPYEVEAVIGIGGMGEVYRARDTRLGRTVAIKVLPRVQAEDPARRERFEREARAVAALSHAHICALYDIGNEDGVPYLVMELLEGETLEARLARKGGSATGSGARAPGDTRGSGVRSASQAGRSSTGRGLPMEQALTIAIEVAEALEVAHRQGVVHRDLKPANIVLTRLGVKVVDFGLARLDGETPPPAEPEEARIERTERPTKPVLTQEATLLGTLPYMAPEQVEGRKTDGRSDIFALGAVMYEMLTGKRPFNGASEASLIAAILDDDPMPISQLRPHIPAALDRLVRECLAKDPDQRWQSAGDLRRELVWIGEGGGTEAAQTSVTARRRRRALRGAAVLGALGLALVTGLAVWRAGAMKAEAQRPALLRLEVPVKGLRNPFGFALSPDGRRLAMVLSDQTGTTRLWLRALDAGVARPTDAEGAELPFWSPDSRFVGMAANHRLVKLDTATGALQTLCEIGGNFRGGAWGEDGTILFATALGGIERVSAMGGAPVAQQKRHGVHTSLWRPAWIPGTRRYLFPSIGASNDKPGLWVATLDRDDAQPVTDVTTWAAVTRGGQIVYARNGTLFSQAFDTERAALTGDPLALADNVAADDIQAAFSVSDTGTLVFRGEAQDQRQLTWFDRSGARLRPMGDPGDIRSFDLSPDGTSVVAAARDAKSRRTRLWITETNRPVSRLLKGDPGADLDDPVFLPDGRSVGFNLPMTEFDGGFGVVGVRSLDGGGDSVLVDLRPGIIPLLEDFSLDGKWISFNVYSWNQGLDLQQGYVMPLPKGEPVVFGERGAKVDEVHFSPDARFIGYHDNSSGRPEVYLRTVPPTERKWQVSAGGGAHARFRRDGKELYYVSLDLELMAVDVTLGSVPVLGAPRPLFRLPIERVDEGLDQYDVTPDGQRFLVRAEEAPAANTPLTVLVNWQSGPVSAQPQK